MIQYNPKDWFTFIFRFHKSDTFMKLLPLMIGIAIYSYVVGYLEMEYWQLSQNDQLKNITIMHTTLGFVISLLLAYRTNTAYDRWWEGRKIWGQLTNASRNFALKLDAMLIDPADKSFFKTMIPAFALELATYLRRQETEQMLWQEDGDSVGVEMIKNIVKTKHRPSQVCKLMHTRINALVTQGKLTPEQALLLNPELSAFADILGACERIKNTPIPYSYSAFIKKFIFVYIMTLPFGYVFNLGYYVVPVVVFIFYVLASLELIAEEIEDPFGADANDLPIDVMAKNIKKHVGEIL